jgi:HEAT repeat protein
MLEEAVQILKEKNQSSSVRLDALLAIVEHFENPYFPLFEEILSDTEDDPDVRSAVALALGKIAGDKPVHILEGVSHDTNPTVRHYVMQALGMTHQPAAAPILIQALKDQNNNVFAAASEALGELGDAAIPHLIDLLSSGATDAQCIAAWQLGELGSSQSVPALVETIRRRADVPVIALCIWALGEIGMGSQEVLDILTEARREEEPDVRLRAETAIKKIVRHVN